MNGVCRNAECPNGANATAVELYPGPGQYCPECGEELEPVAPAAEEAPRTASEARATAPPPPPMPPPPAEPRTMAMSSIAAPAPRPARGAWIRRIAIALVALAIAGGGAVVALRPVAIGRPRTGAIHVCRSSITERLAADVVREYAAKRNAASRFDVAASSAPCDVRFSAHVTGKHGRVIAHDGIVVVVNPQNPLARLNEAQVRQIFRGGITDWSWVGGSPGAIEAILPDDTTDEAQAVEATLLHGTTIADSVRRVRSSADVVRAVASPGAGGTIGIVAFSAAVPAKVLALGSAPVPSALSIADHRYPLSVAVTVDDEGGHDPVAAALARYANSGEAQSIVVRDGLVAKEGF